MAPRAKKKTKKITKPTPQKTEKKTETEEDVTYPEISAKICFGEDAMTVEQAKELLGWEEESKKTGKFTDLYLLEDLNEVKIRCHNNVTNRPLYKSVYETLKQEHLRRRWQMNGEPIIIGRTGLILNGQHTLISLVLAAQELEVYPDRWEDWDEEPTMEKLVVFGIDESDDVVNTMDTCKPRSLADVIYRSEFFADKSDSDRKNVARICDYAVRTMWRRTGAGIDEFNIRRTHAESLDFISRHPRLLECVNHVYEENGGRANNIGKYIGLGYAAGLLYLMGCSDTESDEYHSSGEPKEDQLDWSKWDNACEFFVLLASEATELSAVKKSLGHILDDEGGSVAERTALLVKAWNEFAEGQSVTVKKLELEYYTDEDDVRTLAECPALAGIDLGNPSDSSERVPDPTPDEIKERAATERKDRRGKTAATEGQFEPGDHVWVDNPGGDPWEGEVIEIYTAQGTQTAQVQEDGTEDTYDVPYDSLQLDQPEG